MADKLPERPAYVRGAIVEMRASEYDKSPIDFAGEHCNDSTRWTTMSSDINTAQRSAGASNYKPSIAFLDKDMVKDVQQLRSRIDKP